MSEEKKMLVTEETKEKEETIVETAEENNAQELSPTWAHECIEDIDDWIESQGIYLRQ